MVSLQCQCILGGRNLVRVCNIVVAAIFDFGKWKIGESRNSNPYGPYGRCEGEGGEGRKKIRLPDIIVLLGDSVRWQTELLIGAG